jgi:hypothetical protein
MPKDLQEVFSECMIILQRQFIIFGSDEPTFTDIQIEMVKLLVMGGVKAQDFAYAIANNVIVYQDDEWRDVLFGALERRADINFEILEGQ